MKTKFSHCALCGRAATDLTRHHLIPRTRHHNKRTRRESSRQEREKIIPLCRACHKQVHALLSEKQLERDYNSLEKLAAHPEITKFVDWVRKQPEGKHVTVRTASNKS